MLSRQDAFLDAGPKTTGINNVLKVLKKITSQNKPFFLIFISDICYSNGKLANTPDNPQTVGMEQKGERSVSFLSLSLM